MLWLKARVLKAQHLGLQSCCAVHYLCKTHNSVTHFAHCKKGSNNSTYLATLLSALNELIHVKFLE